VTESTAGSEFHRVFIIGDVHYPAHDPEVLELALSIFEGDEYDEIILNGDIIDCHSLSSYPVHPSVRHHVEDEETWLNKLLDRIELHPTCKVFQYEEGNHEQRMARDHHPQKYKYAKGWDEILELEARGWGWQPWHPRKQIYHPLGMKHIGVKHALSRAGVNFLQQVANNAPGMTVIGGHKHVDGFMSGVNRETGVLGFAHSHGFLGDWRSPLFDYMKSWGPWSWSVLELVIHKGTGQNWVKHHNIIEYEGAVHCVANGYHHSLERD
jgi:predicted phosphodiesterase